MPSHRILVVDDNVDAAESFAEFLLELGHEVRLAHDGQTAIDVASAWAVDIVFLDIGLPDMDGYEVAREMRKRGLEAHLIALTGYGHDEAKSLSKDAGFTQHLVKPPPLDQLLRLLESLDAPRR